jgi:hypothetical protein
MLVLMYYLMYYLIYYLIYYLMYYLIYYLMYYLIYYLMYYLMYYLIENSICVLFRSVQIYQIQNQFVYGFTNRRLIFKTAITATEPNNQPSWKITKQTTI